MGLEVGGVIPSVPTREVKGNTKDGTFEEGVRPSLFGE